MLMPKFDRQDYVCVKYDAICEEFPAAGEGAETLLASYVDVFAELRHNGYRVVICSDRAGDQEHYRRIERHLRAIGMPYDVIMPARLLRCEGFGVDGSGEDEEFLISGRGKDGE